jgi:hypothetical protein
VGYICGLNGAYIKTNTFKGIISIAKRLGSKTEHGTEWENRTDSKI